MEQSRMDKLSAGGIDVQEALDRLMGNEKLLQRLLEKLLSDENFEGLKAAFAAGDQEKAFACSHTLKGVFGNLSAKALFTLFSRQVELLRAGSLQEARELMQEAEPLYQRLLEAIRAYEEEV